MNGSLDAEGEKSVVSELQRMGLIPIRISLSKGNGGRFNFDVSGRILSIFKGVSNRDVMVFTQDLATLLQSGLPVDRTLSILIDASE
ncbi:MAG TPA: type II secretion system protein GspF, partial [Desulfobacteraceae bacterium]|nr:type II secretion system protein GspF [Desulfobacteraceae bacterium]